MTTIVFGNSKGGTAKTTSTLNIGAELGLRGKLVLLIDFDPQASLGKAILGEAELSRVKGIEELLGNPERDPAEYIIKTKIPNVDLLPCHGGLAEASVKLLMNASFFALRDVVRRISGYDLTLIDTQPAKNILMLNAFTVSDYVLIPTNPSIYPLMDIVELEQTIRSTAANSNPGLEVLGVLITMVQRATVYRQLEDDLRGYFKDKVFTTTISRAAKSEESAVAGVGVSALDPTCKLAEEYRALTSEVLARLESRG